MTLMLHVNAKAVDYDALRQLETPAATPTHVPIPHFRVVDLVKTAAGMYGHEIIGEAHGITEDGARYFGLLSLRSPYTGYEDTVGLRNSHDKSFPIGIAFGSQVFVCSNLAFVSDHVIRRRHTANAKRELPGLLMEIIEPLALQREHQAKKFDRYKHTLLTDERADHAVMNMFRQGIINVQRIPEVLHEWDEPTFTEFDERNAWRMLNAATFVLSGKVMERPNATPQLFKVIDLACEHVN